MAYNLKLPKYKNVAIKLEDNVLGYFNVFQNYVEKDLNKVKSLDNFVNLECNEKGYRIKPYIWYMLSEQKECKNEDINLSAVKVAQIVHQVATNLENDTSFDTFKDMVKYEIEKARRQDENEYADLDINEANIANNINRLVTSINKPIIEKFTNNVNNRTFDIVRVRVYLNTLLSEQARRKAIVKYKSAIGEKVIQEIEDSGKFKKFGVTTNYLKLSQLTYIKKTCSLDFVFELKDELLKLGEDAS